jgi:hypothetical protein
MSVVDPLLTGLLRSPSYATHSCLASIRTYESLPLCQEILFLLVWRFRNKFKHTSPVLRQYPIVLSFCLSASSPLLPWGGYVIGSFLFPIRWLDCRKHVSTVHCRYELIPQTGVAVTLSASKGYE